MVSSLTRRFIKVITEIVLSLSVLCSLFSFSYAYPGKSIRVAIMQENRSLRIKMMGYSEIINSLNQKVLSSAKNLTTTVTSGKNSILIGNVESHTNRIFIKTDKKKITLIDGRKFRGDIEIIRRDDARLLVINHIDLEDYIRGILYHETSHYWPIEALKAQAVACRTYALSQMQENRYKDYDLTGDIYSQVYGGRTSERYRTNVAVDDTKDEILIFQGKIFPAFYHATCAGHTEDAALVWKINIAPLKGIACNFCQRSPHFNWHCVLSLDTIKDKLVAAGYQLGEGQIKEIIILERSQSSRVKDLKIISAQKEIKISAKDFRNIIGPNIIKSTNFQLNLVNHDAVFEGFGWGHGVGLCQWGAYFMAKEGYTYQEILHYYYPEAVVVVRP